MGKPMATASQTPSPGFQANFRHTYSVTIPRPLPEVFKTIGTSAGHQRVCRLSKLCTKIDLLEADGVSVPEATQLSELSLRTISPPSSNASKATNGSTVNGASNGAAVNGIDKPTRSLPRQFFDFAEAVPILLGYKYTVQLHGSLTWDERANLALYETRSTQGILVWKLRTFEKLDDNNTKLTERIEGKCPSWLRTIVQKTTTKGHKEHMDSYHTLFE